MRKRLTLSTPMPATLTRAQILDTVRAWPDEVTVDDAIERIVMLGGLEEGLAQARRGEDLVPQAEVERRMEGEMASWQK